MIVGTIRATIAAMFLTLIFSCPSMAWDVSGYWTSEFGPVQLQCNEQTQDGSYKITGHWVQGGGDNGYIENGRWNPQTGALNFKYKAPWKNLKGKATFSAVNANLLRGTYKRSDGEVGSWTLTRQGAFENPSAGKKAHRQNNNWNNQNASYVPVAQQANPNKKAKINGTWNSNFGPVTFSCGSQCPDRSYDVFGSWNQRGKTGSITGGKFYPKGGGGTMHITYFMPWKNMRGEADLTVANNGKSITGSWRQADGAGPWNMYR